MRKERARSNAKAKRERAKSNGRARQARSDMGYWFMRRLKKRLAEGMADMVADSILAIVKWLMLLGFVFILGFFSF